MRVENGSQGTFVAVNWKRTRNLREDSYIMHLVHVLDYVAIRILILEQECPNIWLTPLDHILYRGYDIGISNRDRLVEPREEGSF